MNKKHQCNLCNYSTNRLCNYKDHLKSKRHLVLAKNYPESTLKLAEVNQRADNDNIYNCDLCGQEFLHKSSKSRHIKQCKKNQSNLVELTLKTKIKIVESEKNIKEDLYEKSINILQQQVDKLQTMLAEKPTSITNNSITNNLNYASITYPHAEELKPLNDYALSMLEKNTYRFAKEEKMIYGKKNTKLLELDVNNEDINNEDIDNKVVDNELELDLDDNDDDDDIMAHATKMENDDEQEEDNVPELDILTDYDNKKFVKNIMMYHKLNTLHSTLGQFLIDAYVKKDKTKQAVHLTDASRNSFIYSKLKTNLNEIEWNRDPKGDKVKSIILDPMLHFIGVQINYYFQKIGKKCRENPKGVSDKEFNELNACSKIINMCGKHNKKNKQYELRRKILAYIAPSFQLNRECKSLIEK